MSKQLSLNIINYNNIVNRVFININFNNNLINIIKYDEKGKKKVERIKGRA